jgi:hypothetical protein
MNAITCFKLTHEDWYPSYPYPTYHEATTQPMGLLKVTLYPDVYDRKSQVVVRGMDDFGMEKYYKSYTEAENDFLNILTFEFIRKEVLKQRGFKRF